MNNKLCIVILIFAVITALGFSKGQTEGEQEKYVIKFATAQPPTSIRTKSIQHFKEIVELKSNGRVKVDIYDSGTLGKEREALEGQKLGTIQMLVGDQLPNIVPAIGVFTLPYLFRDRAHAYSVFDGPIGARVLEDLPKNGIHGFPNGYWENGFRNVTNNVRSIEKPEDLKGLKMRVVGQDVYIEFMKTLGALPVAMSFGEVYTALQLGTVDGQDNPLTNIYNGKLHEVQKHLAITEHIYSTVMVTAGEKWWQSLPNDIQEIITEAVGEATKWNREQMQLDEKRSYDKMMAERPDIVVTRPEKKPFADLMKRDLYPKFEALYGMDLIEDILVLAQ